jgi:dTDP-4-dehydrorhamnose 3,5-epimerase
MKLVATDIPDVKILEPEIFGDARGYFLESFRASWIPDHEFVQDNQSKSKKGILRGLHYQLEKPQGKLVRVLSGRVLDVAVDIRKSSLTFGRHVAIELDGQSHRMLWVPPGFAHGFVVLSDEAEFFYKCTDYYAPEDERAIRWNDLELDIDWQLDEPPILSQKDSVANAFRDAEVFD